MAIQQMTRSINLNHDWKFCWAGDINHPTEDMSNAYKVNYNDSNWRKLDLPHDWSIEFDFNIEHSLVGSEAGYLDGGIGWYRKALILPKEMEGKKVAIHFGGVYMDSTVYVNGKQVGKYPNGYMPFTYDIAEYLIIDGVTENNITVKVVNQQPSSRWYSGSGIYRDVELVVTHPIHVAEYGTFVTTPNIEAEYGSGKATVCVQTEVKNDFMHASDVQVRQTVLDYAGNSVETEGIELAKVSLEAGELQTVVQQLQVVGPKLWSIHTPHLYKMCTEILVDNEVVDTYETRWGFRWVKFDANEGFSLNGEWMKLKGVCMHHDQGALGAVANTRAIERQMEIMQEMGANAIRVTHNPAADDLLRICDEKGLMVIDEAFDTWYYGKKQYDLGRFFSQGSSSHPNGSNTITWAEFDLKGMVKRGRNFPCIIKWSVGNEVGEASGDERSLETIKNMKKWVAEVDPTRGITQGADKFRFGTGEGGHEDIAEVQDTVGFNYAEGNYDSIHAKHPEWAIYGSETSSATKSRGVYSHPDTMGVHDSGDHADYQQSSYDNDHVGWGASASHAWIQDRNRKYIAGQFIWTGFDYIGEPTPWHNTGGPGHSLSPKSSYFGIVDTAGFPKDDYYLYQSVWKNVKESPMVHILPHWNWEEETLRNNVTGVDSKIPLRVYSNAPHVELFIDGVSQGVQSFAQKETNYGVQYQQQSDTSEKLYLEWRLTYAYAPGTTIQAVARDHAGEVVAKDTIVTSEEAFGVKLQADRVVIDANGKDLCYITVDVTDDAGNFVPTADNEVKFELVGEGKIVGVDNGNPISHERYQSQVDGTWIRKAFNGKALVIVQSTTRSGSFTVKASSCGLEGDALTIYTKDSVADNEKQVLGYTPVIVRTQVGEQPNLPQTVEMIHTDGTKCLEAVKWESIDTVQLQQVGTFSVLGEILHTQTQVIAEVAVAQMSGVDGVGAKVNSIILNGVPVADFNEATTVYQFKVPYGKKVVDIQVETDDEESGSVRIVPSTTGGRVIRVEAATTYMIHIEETRPQLQEVCLQVATTKLKEDEQTAFNLAIIKEDGTYVPSNAAEISYVMTSEDGGHVELVEGHIYAYTKGTVSLRAKVSYEGITSVSNEVVLHILANEVDKTITAFAPIQVISEVGQAPVLPSTIQAYFNVGFPRFVPVKWAAIVPEQYSQYNQFEVTGTVEGQELVAKAMVTVRGVIATQTVSLATAKNFPATLPEKVMVYYSDNTKEEKLVKWDEAGVDYTQVGYAKVVGHVEAPFAKVEASIRITTQEEQIKVSNNYAKQWTGSEFPAALASFTNDVEESRDRIHAVNDTVIAFEPESHNRWSNWQVVPRENEWVGILFAEGGNITKRYIDTIKVGFFSDHETGAPKDFTIEYYVPSNEPQAPSNFGHVTEGELANIANWQVVEGLTLNTVGVEAGSMQTFSFDAVHTYAIRLNMTRQEHLKGIAITEIEAYGKEAISYESYHVEAILVDGHNIIESFDESLNCTVSVEGDDLPEVVVEATQNARVTIIPATNNSRTTKIEILPENGDVTKTKLYQMHF
ncbi:MAG: glycoside hydrolase family 2 TIM barrel-domain containing protein [Niameybacter sp.]